MQNKCNFMHSFSSHTITGPTEHRLKQFH